MISLEFLLASAIGLLIATGIYLILRARTFPVVLGLAMIGYAVGRERASGDAGSIASARACFELYNAAKRMMRANRGELDAYAIENR